MLAVGRRVEQTYAPQHWMSNCLDIVEASGPHLYVEVKEQSALML